MGRSYSVNGYLNAILQRSARTLLVEGHTDVYAINRLLAEEPNQKSVGFVDHAGLFDDDQLTGLGHKAKVAYVKGKANELSGQFPKLLQAFGSLIDREWDGLSFAERKLSGGWSSPEQSESHFVTFGHSMENYHFDVDCMLGYLRLRFADHYTLEFSNTIRGRFQSAIALAGALSMAAKENGCLTKCASMLSSRNVEFKENRYYLSASVEQSYLDRKIVDPAALIREVNHSVDDYWTALAAEPFARWLVHGHIGADVLWACAANVAGEKGIPPEICEEMARGHQQERKFYWIDWLSKTNPQMRLPLDSARTWLYGDEMPA